MKKEIEIPEGYEAKIVGNKVVIEPKESEDEKIMKAIGYAIANATHANNTLIYGVTQDEAYSLLEKQKEQKPAIIQWTGNNLKEVIDFTGKSPKFGEWFKSWEDFENYVHSHGNILKLFCEDGSHYEVPVGAWIVKTPDGYNVPSVARFVSSSTEIQQRNANGCLSWKEFKDDYSGIPALLVSQALIRRDGKYSIGFDVISGDEYILIRDIEAAVEQKPAEWSEEDKRKIDDIIRVICDARECSKIANIGEEKELEPSFYNELVLFLKSLSKRFNLQPKEGWSKEDKEVLGKVFECIRFAEDHYQLEEEQANGVSVKSWLLDHINPQPHWKPSEEQMEILRKTFQSCYKTGKHNIAGHVLESLYNDLKKL